MYPFLCLHPNQQISNAVLPSTKKTILYRWRSAPKETLFSGIALITNCAYRLDTVNATVMLLGPPACTITNGLIYIQQIFDGCHYWSRNCLSFRSTWVHPQFLEWGHVTQSLVLCVMFCRSLFVLLSFLFWPLCCLSFFDLQILITPLVSSNSLFDKYFLLSSN